MGLCKAQKLLYITTRGGDFSLEETLPLELGTPYIRGICRMLGIGEFLSLSADGLDIWGNDPQKILEDAKKKAVTIARCF